MVYGEKYDVVIVGSGPAGSLLGYHLARRRAKVLILEKKRLPRYKPCGGGLTKKTLDILPFDVSGVIEDYAYSANVLVHNKPVFIGSWDHPIVGTVMRDKFDYFLVEKAVREGAVVRDQINFQSISGRPGDLKINTSGGTCGAKIIVGADGVNSRVARALGLHVRKQAMYAIQGEVFPNDPGLLCPLKGTVSFDFGVIPHGYGWVFPKRDHLSVGVLSTSKTVKNLKRYFLSFLEMRGLKDRVEIKNLSPHLIPYRAHSRNTVADPRGLLVGDAAGLADPITGEGILYAVEEARLAAEIILDSLRSAYGRLTEYNHVMRRELLRDIQCAKRLGYLIYPFPRLGYRILKSYGATLGAYQADIISGFRTYDELQNAILKLPSMFSFIFHCRRRNNRRGV